KMYDHIADVNAQVEDAVSGVRVVQSFTNEQYEKDLFATNNYRFRSAKLMAYRVMAFVNSNIYFVMRFAILFVLVIGAWLSFYDQLSYGELVAFVLYMNVLFNPIQKVSALLELHPKGIAGFKCFTEERDDEPEVQNRPHAQEATALTGNIAFNDVTFCYEKRQAPILKNVSVNVAACETIALVGPSGAGKTTI